MEPERAQLCKGIWLPESEVHFKMMIETKSKIPEFNGRGTYQKHKLDKAMDLLGPDRRRTCIDIGAHCGLWAMFLVDLFDDVECFEPVDEFSRLLPWNVLGTITGFTSALLEPRLAA